MPNTAATVTQLSVIIPCRNEAMQLPHLLQDLAAQEDIALEVIVADGDSSDDSIAVAQLAGAKVCQSQANRALQMNTGATLATSPWLLFLHADSQLTHPQQLSHAVTQMRSEQGPLVAGHFSLKFVDRPLQQKRWRVLEYKTTTNLPLTINGDQGMLLSRESFEALGGFSSDLPILEDQILAADIHKRGRWILLNGTLETSARRFTAQGFQQRYLLMTLIMVAHCCGLKAFLDPKTLYPEQRLAKRITLADHIRRFHHLAAQYPLRQIISFYWRIAGMSTDNLYQIPLWLDAGCGFKTWPLSNLWLNTVAPICRLPGLKQALQLLMLPMFPVITHLWLLKATIAAKIKHFH